MKPTLRMPVWFEAPDTPIKVKPIRVEETTTARQLAMRTMLGARKFTIPGSILTVGHQIGEALVPVIMGLAIDRALATGDTGQLLLWILILGANFAMLSFSYRFGSRVSYLGMQSVQHQLRTMVTDRLLTPQRAGKAALPGASLSIATSDVLRLSTLIALSIYPIGMLGAIIFCAVILLTISWVLGLAVLIGAPLLLLAMDKSQGPLRRRTETQQALAADAAGRAADLVTGYRVIKGIGAEAEAAQRYRTISQEALATTLRAKTAQGLFTGTSNLVTGVFIAALAVTAGIFALNGSLTIGQLITVVGLTQFIMSPLQGLVMFVSQYWPPGLASAGRVLKVLKQPARPMSQDHAQIPEAGTLELTDITTGPITGLNLRVEPGECVGVATDGETARALTELLAVRQTPETGTITWNGVDLFDDDLETVRQRILMSPHAGDLFDGTINDNIDLPGAQHIEEAINAAGCREFLEHLPDGLHTPVGEGGTRLSGGQRQRVALARALAQPAPLLVLHDPTTAVDSVTEAGIAEQLPRIRHRRSTLIITSSPALLAACDRVTHLDTTRENV